MVSVKRFKPGWGLCHYDWCREITCIHNGIQVPMNGRPTLPDFGVCPIMDADEEFNVLFSDTMKRFENGEIPSIPDKLRYGKKRERVQNPIPVDVFDTEGNLLFYGCEGPTVDTNQRPKKCIKDLIRHLMEH